MSEDSLETRLERRRTVVDPSGRVWTVREIASAYDRRGATSLIFEADIGIRRVRNFPARWFELRADELWAVSELT